MVENASLTNGMHSGLSRREFLQATGQLGLVAVAFPDGRRAGVRVCGGRDNAAVLVFGKPVIGPTAGRSQLFTPSWSRQLPGVRSH